MECNINFFSLSKSEQFHQAVSKSLGAMGKTAKFETFISFMEEIVKQKPNVLIIDLQTSNLTTEVLEIFCLQEFSFVDCVIVVGEEKAEIGGKFLFSLPEKISESISEALIVSLKNEMDRMSTGKYADDSKDIVNAVMIKLGFQKKHIGTTYLRTAIELVCENKNCIASFNKSLYPILSEQFDTSINNVERNIRNSIKGAFLKTGKDAFEEVLGTKFYDCDFPPNRTFITALCDLILNDDKSIKQRLLA